MLLEDFNMDNPDLQPWDPRIQKIVKYETPAGFMDKYQFIVYLHCKRKFGWAVAVEFAQQISAAELIQMLRSETQSYIDTEYKKLQQMAGGSVDIYGKPILTLSTEFFPIWEDSNLQAISSGLKVAQLTDEEQYQAWCKQAESLKGATAPAEVPAGEIWYPAGWTAEGFITKPTSSTSSIVQRNLKKLFPGLLELVTCPVCKNKDATIDPQQMQLDRAIIHLNDIHKWMREEVADWLESLDIDITMKEENV